MELYQAAPARASAVALVLAMGLLAAAPVHAAQDGTDLPYGQVQQVGEVRPTPRLPDTGPGADAGLGVTLLAGGLVLIALTRRRGAAT